MQTIDDCGACGNACQIAGAVEACINGSCTIGVCEVGYADCNGNAADGCEVDIDADELNCGACGTSCTNAHGATSCQSGACVASCNAGWDDCDGDPTNGCETNLNTVDDCGTCGTTCSVANATETCTAGTCGIASCDADYADCNGNPADGCETATAFNNTNCGTCGNSCMNANGSTQCIDGSCSPSCAAGFADCNSQSGDGCETDVTTTSNCGGCGNVCSIPNATEACSSGACAIGACAAGWADCNVSAGDGCEVDIAGDEANCGGCGNTCTNANGTNTCQSGNCVPTCSVGWDSCDADPDNGCETRLDTLSNCGSCGSVCNLSNAVETCSAGSCQIGVCDAGYANCDGSAGNGCEVSITNDAQNCGGCGNVCIAANGTNQCVAGACVPTCAAGWSDCDGDPTNGCETPLNTTSNCGACGTVCALPGAAAACVAGMCAIDTCNSGRADCNGLPGDGCETNTDNDESNCGVCGLSCTNAHGSTNCQSGACVATCNAGWDSCDGDPNNGCETSLTTLSDCGTCGSVCALDNASESCASGSCALSACAAGFANCNGNIADGCEIQIENDESNCGACGVTCTALNGTNQCLGGACNPVCAAGWSDCDGDPTNGCETSITTIADCGSCGNACSLAGASPACVSGACAIASCNAGRADCNGNVGDGCEVNTDTEEAHCGTCGNTCTNAHGTNTCQSGNCVATCSTGWDSCNGDPDDGCETSLTTLTDCGSCGTACALANAGETCSSGSCAITTCDAGWANCNASASDGCEVSIASDEANCGACGTVCQQNNGTNQCVAGSCTPSCAPGWSDCDGNPNNGCETNITTTSNCGSCGNACDLSGASESCVGGACTVATCDPGRADCNGNAGDGCEIVTDTDEANCGTCGNTCTNAHGTNTCQSGSCVATCNSGWDSCNGDPDDGCETALNTLANCGSCGTTCALDNAAESCSGGSCVITSCDGGYANCDGSAANGCEVNTGTDEANCGGCGVICQNVHSNNQCVAGSCTPACSLGWSDCDGNPNNGCETFIASTSNCGSCGNACNVANANEACTAGSCTIASCSSGFADCNGNYADGCEVSTNTSSTNCGACGNTCTNSHGSTSCQSGSCTPSCSTGWDDCDGDPDDGCETQLNTLTNCGGCGVSCSLANGSQSCSTGSCILTDCNSGYCDLNNVASDGCELNLEPSLSCSTNYTSLGSVSGDTSSPAQSYTARGERWFRVLVTENNSSIIAEDLKVRFHLAVPAGTDYDLYVYCANCGATNYNSSVNGAGADETLEWYINDGTFSSDDDDRYFYIRVEHWSADVCSSWTLTVTGDHGGDKGRECD